MGIIGKMIELWLERNQDPEDYNYLMSIQLSRSDYYKLQMVSDDLNKADEMPYRMTPEILATKVVRTFIREAYRDSTKRITQKLLPEIQQERNRQ